MQVAVYDSETEDESTGDVRRASSHIESGTEDEEGAHVGHRSSHVDVESPDLLESDVDSDATEDMTIMDQNVSVSGNHIITQY